VAAQLPVSFLGTRDFALRPRLWLKLMDRTRSTVAFSPPFGYKLAARRLKGDEGALFDLSRWRVAGVGAEMIRPEALTQFARATHGSGFDPCAFLPCYGMAEVALAVSFSGLDEAFGVDCVNREDCTVRKLATPAVPGGPGVSEFVNCGRPLPGVTVEIRNEAGEQLGDREIGVVWVRSASAMNGYLNNPEATEEVLFGDWVNTGDLAYTVDGSLYITGRAKDMIIVNGRNIWPQDLEAVAESYPGVRPGDAMAFSLHPLARDLDGEAVVMLVQYRMLDDTHREDFAATLEARLKSEFGVACTVELVGPHALPRTSSGKPSRSQARANYLAAAQGSAVPPA
jgi:fatty-acyl-CoA synthase